ncbi:hypothetical protein LINGRAHAP2_LOCUS7518 [Linum grandiflorum]
MHCTMISPVSGKSSLERCWFMRRVMAYFSSRLLLRKLELQSSRTSPGATRIISSTSFLGRPPPKMFSTGCNLCL